jgi:formate hydrogenlyase subunit 3/multisubunit Na+/H+ antiporter MnhD subunit
MTSTLFIPPVELTLFTVGAWLFLGLLAIAFQQRQLLLLRLIFPLTALGGLGLMVAGWWGMHGDPSSLVLPLGLPDLPFHLREDALSGFFLLLLGGVAFATSIYSGGYFRNGLDAHALALLTLQYNVFLAGMALVLVADDAYSFLVAWEVMAVSSYFLVTTEHHEEQNRWAGFVYLLMAHVGAVAILLSFGVLHGGAAAGHAGYAFSAMREVSLSDFWRSVAFFLAFFGFGAKAGMLPLHVWLPDAHPAAPTPVSALMSGVMLKTAIYGMVRFTFDLIGHIQWQWGLTVLLVGTASALFGILYALMQHDLKRLLAYSSVENIGIILIGLGLSLVFFGTGHPLPGVLGLVAALYHTLNHAVVKGLLFLGAGSVLHATHERDLNAMGGLIHRMPHTAAYFLIGALAISALPPLNGFISEWLTFQTALQALALESGGLRSLIPLAAAVLALTGALTAMCFVKVYGITFLGRPRKIDADAVHEVSLMERMGMAWLAAGCFVLGLFPLGIVRGLNHVSQSLTGQGLNQETMEAGWLWLVPVTIQQASYSPMIFFIVVVAVVGFTFFGIRVVFHGRLRRSDPWDCGFPAQTARMQDSADAFGQPIRHFFAPIFLMHRRLPAPDDPAPRFEIKVEDRHWPWLYLPLAGLVEAISTQIGKVQHGRISLYLLYSFVTLLVLLALV